MEKRGSRGYEYNLTLARNKKFYQMPYIRIK